MQDLSNCREAKGTGQGRNATGAVQYTSLQNSQSHSHYVLNVLRVTNFIFKLYEPSGQEIHSGHKTHFFLFVVDVLLFVEAPGNSKFFRKKHGPTVCTPAVDMLQSE